MADLAQKQAAVLQETLRLVGFHSDDYQFLTQTEASLWMTYETTIRQKKGAEAENIINQIKNNPDLLDRVVSLIDVIRTLDLDAAGNMAMDNLQENVRLLDEKRDKERLAREAEAERKLAQQGSDAHAAYQKHLALLKQVIAVTKETDPQVAAALESSLPDIAPSLILEPIGTIEKLAAVVAPEILAPLISEISHPVIENVYLQTFQFIPQPAAAAAVTVLKIATPQATVPQIQQLLDRLTLASEVVGKPLSIPPTVAVSISQIQAPSPTLPPLTLSLHNQFLRAGYPAPQAQTLASQFATQFVPLINTIASFTPHQPTDSPQQHSQRVSQVQVYFSNQVIEYLSLRTVYFTRPAQFYSFQDNYSPSSHLTPNQSGWLNYLANSAKNKVLGKVQDVVWEKFAASEVGKKVLTSLGTKAATTAATEAAAVGAEAAAGAALAPETLGLSLLIPLAIEAVKTLWSKGKILIKKYLPAIALGLTALVGGIIGGLGLVGASALGLTGAVAGTAIQGSGGVAGALTKAGNAITAGSTAMVGLVATEIATPIIIIIISIPIGIALILFIINSSALVVPPNMYTASSSANLAYTGPLPEGCPTTWPVQDSATINQGAWVPASVYPNASHKNVEAIDVGVAYKQVFATHNGIAFPKVGDGGFATYGNFVDVYSTCTYKNVPLRIISRYAHLSSFLVSPNTPIQKGQAIAISGNSGGVPLHLHYEFRQDNGTVYGLATNLQTDTAPFMWPEFVPTSPLIPRGCWSYNDTGAKLPCNTIIP